MSRSGARGFTLLEVMVALAIAATALVVLMGRLGSSADIQRDLTLHAEALDVAIDELERIRMQPQAVPDSTGDVKTENGTYRWRSKQQATVDPKFVRQDITVTDPDGGHLKLFLYRSLP